MQDSELYEKLLGLKEPWFVEKVSLELSGVILFPQQGHDNSPRGTSIVTPPSEAAVKQLDRKFDF